MTDGPPPTQRPARQRQASHPVIDEAPNDIDRLKRRIESLERERSQSMSRMAEEVVAQLVAQLVVALRAEVENAVGAHVAPLVLAVDRATKTIEKHVEEQKDYRARRESAEAQRKEEVDLEHQRLINAALAADVAAKREALPTGIDGTQRRRLAYLTAGAGLVTLLSNLVTALVASHVFH